MFCLCKSLTPNMWSIQLPKMISLFPMLFTTSSFINVIYLYAHDLINYLGTWLLFQAVRPIHQSINQSIHSSKRSKSSTSMANVKWEERERVLLIKVVQTNLESRLLWQVLLQFSSPHKGAQRRGLGKRQKLNSLDGRSGTWQWAAGTGDQVTAWINLSLVNVKDKSAPRSAAAGAM